MDGVHDMGGMDGFGKVEPEPNEPVFHQRWEGRVLAMSRALGVFRAWTIDTSRYAIELFSPAVYLTSSYYEKWFLRNVRLLVERGLIDEEEVRAGHALSPGKNLSRGRFTLADVAQGTRRGSYGRPPPGPARFKVGDRVRTKHPPDDAHALTALCARPHGSGRTAAWRSRVSRLRDYRQRRRSAVALYGSLRRPGALGRGRGSKIEDLHRGV
jgi:nitrile hydratase